MLENRQNATLRYCSPFHGDWDVARIALNLPESHILFVCPYSCARNVVLNATQFGLRERISVLGLTERDIVMGGNDLLTLEAAEQLIAQLPRRPRVLILFVSCIDSMLGADHEEELAELSQRHPDMRFLLMRMNPICQDTAVPPAMQLPKDLFSLLSPPEGGKRDRAVNFIGGNVMLRTENELAEMLRRGGFELRHVATCPDYPAFERMAASALNLVQFPFGLPAARFLEERLGAEYLVMPLSPQLAAAEAFERQLALRLGLTPPDFPALYRSVEEEAAATRRLLGDMPVLLDSLVSLTPLALARALLELGLNVRGVYLYTGVGAEAEQQRWLAEHAPQVQIVDSAHFNVPNERRFEAQEAVALGIECACYAAVPHVARMTFDEGLWGFEGMCELLRRLRAAHSSHYDMRDYHKLEVRP